MPYARGDFMDIPFKQWVDLLRLDEGGEIDPASLALATGQVFDNYKEIERWAQAFLLTTDPSRCHLFIPFKELADLSITSAEHIFDSYKEVERWAHRVFKCECGCASLTALPDKCHLFIPFKDCFVKWRAGDISLEELRSRDFDNWKAIERWAFLHYSGECCVVFGGTIYDSGGYRYHEFEGAGTYELVLCNTTVEYLVVAGGGGTRAGQQAAGGGGGGGVLSGTTTGRGIFAVTVGAGGDNTGTATSQGGDSSLETPTGTVTAIGGGRGSAANSGAGGNGGSGGGGNSGVNSGNPVGLGGIGTVGQGFDGGVGNVGTSITGNRAGGGGGGAAQQGFNATPAPTVTAGKGGNGVAWVNGAFYGGGGGGGDRGSAGAAGGLGGGGAGSAGDTIDPTSGTNGLGGGAGGPGFGTTGGGLGGYGTVIIRYPI